MKKNTTYGAMALSLVLLLSVAPAMAMEGASDNTASTTTENETAPEAARAEGLNPSFRERLNAILASGRNRAQNSGTATADFARSAYASIADFVRSAATSTANGARFAANPFPAMNGFDESTYTGKVRNWMGAKYATNPKTVLAAYYSAVTLAAAGTSYAIYKLAPKAKAKAIALYKWATTAKAVETTPEVAPVAPAAPVVKAAPAVTVATKKATVGQVARCNKKNCRIHRRK